MWTIHPDKNWDALRAAFSWIQDMEGVPQSPIYHAEGDVAIHTRMVAEALIDLPDYQVLEQQEQELLFAAALLHDVEKRSTTQVEADGQIHSRGHARKGEYTARQILYRNLPTPFAFKEQVAKLVRYHGLPLWIFEKVDPQKALLQASTEVDTRLLSLLARADVLGRICPDQEEMLERIQFFEAFCQEQNCWGKLPEFPSALGKYLYFHRSEASPLYHPYEKDRFEVCDLRCYI